MNTHYAHQKLNEAKARAQGPDAGERAIGKALVAYWSQVLCQLGHVVWSEPCRVELLEPGWDRDEPQSPWLHSRN